MVMSLNSFGGGYGNYGSFGMNGQTSGGGNVPMAFKSKYNYDFDFYDKPKVAAARYDVTPKAPPIKKHCSKFLKFLGIE